MLPSKSEKNDVNLKYSSENSEQEYQSTIKKYIERFRKSTPMSRPDRVTSQSIRQEDFWWVSQSATGCVAEDSSSDNARLRLSSLRNSSSSTTMYSLDSRTSHSPSHQISLPSQKHVASSSPPTRDRIDALDRQIQQQRVSVYTPTIALRKSMSMPVSPIKAVEKGLSAVPEDDILAVWRLRHKLELIQRHKDPLKGGLKGGSPERSLPPPSHIRTHLTLLEAHRDRHVHNSTSVRAKCESCSQTSPPVKKCESCSQTSPTPVQQSESCSQTSPRVIQKSVSCSNLATATMNAPRGTAKKIKKRRKRTDTPAQILEHVLSDITPKANEQDANLVFARERSMSKLRDSVDSLGLVSDFSTLETTDFLPRHVDAVLEAGFFDDAKTHQQQLHEASGDENFNDDVLGMLQDKHSRFLRYLNIINRLVR